MILAAIYLDDHEYLTDAPQTINFGGEYLYGFKKENENVIISREKNNTYLKGFFNLTNIDSKILNLSSIVGQNGAGKSTILDLIRAHTTKNQYYAFPWFEALFLIEEEDTPLPIIILNDFGKVYLEESGELIEINESVNKSPQTIYYTPHYDYKYNANFDNADDHDISFRKIVEKDLSAQSEKEATENGWPYSPSQELLFKNSTRQIEFLSSNLVDKKDIFKDVFELPHHYEPILYFRGYKKPEIVNNTPNGLRPILDAIMEKVMLEYRNCPKIRKYHKDKLINQLEINKYLLKRNVIKSVINVFYKQMERNNSYLFEGEFLYNESENELNKYNAFETLMLFINHSIIKIDEKVKYIFREGSLEKLVYKINSFIDEADSEDSVKVNSLRTNRENAILLLKLHRDFLIEINNYYYLFQPDKKSITRDENERVEGFIDYMPFERRLSSGENALLDLFSRLYDFLDTNLKEIKYKELKSHYILLLDEADLAFHPAWKKKYVDALLKTIPHFFNELENSPSIQIIFTTHDPLTLSDLPNNNVIYIKRNNYQEKPKILDYKNKDRPQKTFGANISELLADSFFVDDSLMGVFAHGKIKDAIKWLNDKENKENKEYYATLIKTIIDEPIVQQKLAEMYDDKMSSDIQVEILNKQIKKLEEQKNKLKN